GGEDRSARVWDLAKAAPTQAALFRNDDAVLHAPAYAPDGKALALGGASTAGSLWDVGRRTPLRRFAGHPTHVSHLDYTPDRSRLVGASGVGFVLRDANTGRRLYP